MCKHWSPISRLCSYEYTQQKLLTYCLTVVQFYFTNGRSKALKKCFTGHSGTGVPVAEGLKAVSLERMDRINLEMNPPKDRYNISHLLFGLV